MPLIIKTIFFNSDCIESEKANNLRLPRAYLPPAPVTPSRWSNAKYIFDFAPAKCKKNDHNDISPDSLMEYAQFENLKSIFEKYTYLGGSSYFVFVCGFLIVFVFFSLGFNVLKRIDNYFRCKCFILQGAIDKRAERIKHLPRLDEKRSKMPFSKLQMPLLGL